MNVISKLTNEYLWAIVPLMHLEELFTGLRLLPSAEQGLNATQWYDLYNQARAVAFNKLGYSGGSAQCIVAVRLKKVVELGRYIFEVKKDKCFYFTQSITHDLLEPYVEIVR